MEDFRLPLDLAEGEIRAMQWNDTGEIVTQNAHMIGLPPGLRESLLGYCDDMGITQIMKELTTGHQEYRRHRRQYHQQEDGGDALLQDAPLLLDYHTDIRLKDFDWYIQRADRALWKSDMHWMSPSDAVAQENYLEALSQAGFDKVLRAVGDHFGFQGLVAYHLSVIAVSHCQSGSLHVDATNTGSRAMNVIIPLVLASDTGPELQLQSDDTDGSTQNVGKYRYQYDVAALVGDDAYHGTGAVQYRNEMRMAATVYIADIGADNIDAVLSDYVTYAQAYPPPNQPDILLRSAKKHWDSTNPSKRLPVPVANRA
jgi:hypothetical protein